MKEITNSDFYQFGSVYIHLNLNIKYFLYFLVYFSPCSTCYLILKKFWFSSKQQQNVQKKFRMYVIHPITQNVSGIQKTCTNSRHKNQLSCSNPKSNKKNTDIIFDQFKRWYKIAYTKIFDQKQVNCIYANVGFIKHSK